MTAPVLRYYPAALFAEGRMLWEIQGGLIGSGQTASGPMPTMSLSGGGLWKATLGQVPIYDADRRRTWRAFAAICDNGVQPIVVPVRETFDAPWPVVSGAAITSFAQVPHSDDALFSDDTGYDNGIIEIETVGATLLRATQMVVNIIAGSDLRGGEYFSIDHPDLRWRLYRIRTVIDNGDNTWNITFRPPLRADVADGISLDFDKPKCVMRLATPDAMDVTLEPPDFTEGNVSFIEAFPPFPT